MQQAIASFDDGYAFLELPDPAEEVLPGVRWGRHEEALTPAFWAAAAWMEGEIPQNGFRLGENLPEEVCACILGGYGIPAEVGLAAFFRVRERMRAAPEQMLSELVLQQLLSAPLAVNGRLIQYRFARQRARYLSESLRQLARINSSCLDDIELRSALMDLPGIGPKTASWIVRNYRASDHVAVLDVHVVRACRIMGVFSEGVDAVRSYHNLEARFVEFCRAVDVRPSFMDVVMWNTMRRLSRGLLDSIGDYGSSLRKPDASKVRKTEPRRRRIGINNLSEASPTT